MIFKFALAAALLGAGVSFLSVDQASAAQAVSPDPSVDAVRDILDVSLTNYPETRFRNVRLVATGFGDGPNKVKGFCGAMNTPNTAGGYSGWSDFFVSDIPVVPTAPDRLYVLGIQNNLDRLMPGSTIQTVKLACGGFEQRLDNRDYADALTYRRGN